MLSDPALEKTRLKDMNEKPILLLRTNEELTEEEEWMFKNSKPLLTYQNISLAEFDIKRFNESFLEWEKDALNEIAMMGSWEELRSDTSLNIIVHKDFNLSNNSHSIFNGSGDFYQKKGNHVLLSEAELNSLPEGEYEISFWLYVDTRTDNMPDAIFYKLDKDGKQLGRNKWNNREEHNIYGNWVRIDETISIANEFEYRLDVSGKYISIDELLLQPKGSNVFIENKGGISLFNNFPIVF